MKLIKSNNSYKLVDREKVEYEFNTLKELFYCARVFDIKVDDLEQALVDMEVNNHNSAEFGDMNSGYLFSEVYD